MAARLKPNLSCDEQPVPPAIYSIDARCADRKAQPQAARPPRPTTIRPNVAPESGTVMRQNKPWSSTLPPGPGIPAEKNNVSGSPPLPPLPKRNPQSPSIAIGLLEASVSEPREAPVEGSNALVWPSPKLPTKTSFAHNTKLADSTARAHGEFSTPFEAKRFKRFPFRSNSSINPCPAPATSSCFAAS